MPRKLRKTLEPATSVTDAPSNEPLIPPETPPGPKRRGRPPTRPETIAKRQAEEQVTAPKMDPAEMKPVTTLVLGMIAKGIKGDPPTQDEIDLVNPSAAAVANKYGINLDRFPEIALLGALLIVGQQMRERRAEREAREKPHGEKYNSGSDRPEVQWKKPIGPGTGGAEGTGASGTPDQA